MMPEQKIANLESECARLEAENARLQAVWDAAVYNVSVSEGERIGLTMRFRDIATALDLPAESSAGQVVAATRAICASLDNLHGGICEALGLDRKTASPEQVIAAVRECVKDRERQEWREMIVTKHPRLKLESDGMSPMTREATDAAMKEYASGKERE